METLDEKIQALTEKVGGMESTESGYDEAKAELDHLIAIRDHGEEGAKLVEERAQVEKELAEELQKGAESNKQRVADLESRYADILREIMNADQQVKQQEQLQQHEERVQKQTEQLDGLAQQIQDMDLFGKALPRDPFESLLGLTEYTETQQMFNQILYAWATGLQKGTFEQHNAEITDYQAQLLQVKEELRAGGERELQLKRQNDELQHQALLDENEIEQLKKATLEMQDERDKSIAERNEWVNKYNYETERLAIENIYLSNQVRVLENKLAEEQKPKSIPATSQSLTDQLKALQDRSIKSAKEIALEGAAFRGKVVFEAGQKIEAPALPSVNLPSAEVAQSGATFPTQTADHHGDSAAADSEVQQEGVTFQVNPLQDGQREVDGNAVKTEVVEPDASVREEITTINKRLDRLEKQAGIDERVA